MTIVKPVIIVHGGAKTISADKVAANQAGCRSAVEAGWAVLSQGGSVAVAVEAAIRVLESNPTFNAGFGSTLTSEGEVEVDAAMMEGETLGWGAVAAVQGVRHPIAVAHKIMKDKITIARCPEWRAVCPQPWHRDVRERRLGERGTVSRVERRCRSSGSTEYGGLSCTGCQWKFSCRNFHGWDKRTTSRARW